MIEVTTTREKEWTIMVYMAGDNNLNDDMFAGILGLKERLRLSPLSKVSFLIYFDGLTLTAKTLQIDFSGSQPDMWPVMMKAAHPVYLTS